MSDPKSFTQDPPSFVPDSNAATRPSLFQQAYRSFAGNLPTLAAITGGSLGAIAGIPLIPETMGTSPVAGAALGAAALSGPAKALQSYMLGREQSPAANWSEAGRQGELAAYGETAGPVLGLAGRGAMRYAVKPSARAVERFAHGGKDIIQSILAGRQPVSRAASETVGPLEARFAQQQAGEASALTNRIDAARAATIDPIRARAASEQEAIAREAAASRTASQARLGESATALRSSSTGRIRAAALSEKDATALAFEEKVAAERAAKTAESQKIIQSADASGEHITTAAELAQDALKTATRKAGHELDAAERLKVIQEVRGAASEALSPAEYGLPPVQRTTFKPSEVDEVRRVMREQRKAAISAGEAGKAPPRSLAGDIENSAKRVLYDNIPGLGEARAAEKEAIRLNQEAIAGNTRRIALRGAKGNATAQDYTFARRASNAATAQEKAQVQARITAEKSKQSAAEMAKIDEAANAARAGVRGKAAKDIRSKRAIFRTQSAAERAAAKTAPPSDTEQQMLIAQALSGAANRRLPLWLHYGLPGLAGGADYMQTHDPVQAGAVALGTLAATTPQAMSRAALVATDPLAQLLAQRSPHLIRRLLFTDSNP